MALAQGALTGPVELPAAGAVAGGSRAAMLVDPPGAAVPGIILSRPIFAPSATAAASDGAAPADPLGGTTIAGSVQVGRVRYVMVQPPGAAVRRVGIGGAIAGWRLAGIGASEAVLARGAERLRIAYGTRANGDGDADASAGEDQQ